jgi:hypothetical protein
MRQSVSTGVLATILMLMAIIVTVLGFFWWVFNLGIKFLCGEYRAMRMRRWVHKRLLY